MGPADEALMLSTRSSFYTVTGKTEYGDLSVLVVDHESSSRV